MHLCKYQYAFVAEQESEEFVCGSTGMYLCERERRICLWKYWYAFFIRVGERDVFAQVPVCICVVAGERERMSLCKYQYVFV